VEFGSALGRMLFSALGGRHPIRLLIGVSLSSALKFIISILAKTNPEASFWSAMNEFSLPYFIFFVAPLLFIPVVFRRRGAPESAIHQANTLQMLLDQAKITGVRRQKFWNEFIERYIAALKPGLAENPDLKKVFDETVEELPQ